jgi:transposase-like protein
MPSLRGVYMSELSCKRCSCDEYVKNGKVRGLQRYLCQSCGCNFTDTAARGKPAAMKALAVLLYCMGNMSFNGIARLLGVSDVSVLNWVRKEGSALPKPDIAQDAEVVILDEMHHFLQKKSRNCGYGGHLTQLNAELWDGCWVSVTMLHSNSSLQK